MCTQRHLQALDDALKLHGLAPEGMGKETEPRMNSYHPGKWVKEDTGWREVAVDEEKKAQEMDGSTAKRAHTEQQRSRAEQRGVRGKQTRGRGSQGEEEEEEEWEEGRGAPPPTANLLSLRSGQRPPAGLLSVT
ncbi:hypothetical protein EYF80_032854 [Liparis tanakae]|uniref:Uncharacterized protein n=1 Tax=Liparis tanakae TaxID=230148 RepID=A0A4Z2GTU8_9TELE|nr:hypothetical protein EYF80_032854 [Liparis tanakae]